MKILKSIMNPKYKKIITIDPGKRGGKACIRNMRISVYDVLKMLASGMKNTEILEEFPELTGEVIKACMEYAAEREHNLSSIV